MSISPELASIYADTGRLILTDPASLIKEGRDRLNGTALPIRYDAQRDIHVIGLPEKSNQVFVANAGDVSMNEAPVLEEAPEGRTDTLDLGDAMDGPILFHQTMIGDEFIYREYPGGAPDPTYNARLLQNIQQGYDSIGIQLGNANEVSSISTFLKQDKPESFVPHTLSPRVLDGPFIPQAMIHMAMYTKSGFQNMCEAYGIPTPPTKNLMYTGENAQDFTRQLADEFIQYEDLVISLQTGCSGEGVFFMPNDQTEIARQMETIYNTLYSQSPINRRELMMVQGRIPKEYLMNSPCFRAYIGNDTIMPIGVTMQRIVNGGYSGNTWHRDIAEYLETISPGFTEINHQTLQMLQQAGVRGVVNLDSMIVSQEGANKLGFNSTTQLREANIRPAFSHPLGRIAQGEVNGLPVDQIQTNFRTFTDDEWYYSDEMMETLNRYTTPDIQAFIGLRYPSWAPSDAGRTYIVFAANDRVSSEELNAVHEKTVQLLGKNS